MSETVPCPLCSRPAPRRHGAQTGYQAPKVFAIHHCDGCETAFCQPLEVDPAVYEAIYRNVETTPGYARYLDYSKGVLTAADPLAWLADREDVYWGIRQYMDARSDRKLKVLEIGSGLGYLTHSLNRRGHEALGLDLSQTAVDAATKRYGPYYRCGDAVRYAETSGERYDVIVATELIEHVPDVRAFLGALGRLLKAGGDVILTTPNRTAYPPDVLWETEPPPVHLWWFSENAIEHLGGDLGLETTFVDFSAYNVLDPDRPRVKVRKYQPTRGGVLDASGKVVTSTVKRVLHALGLRPATRALRHAAKRTLHSVRKRPETAEPRRTVLCAVMHRPA
ncbi:MAG: methyltransferase domain-containing protein [Candidatus Tectomicrobia bacterium]|nr:methyltransferase domain-containing protein [Candidatus Tectomicrobia bacterium]